MSRHNDPLHVRYRYEKRVPNGPRESYSLLIGPRQKHVGSLICTDEGAWYARMIDGTTLAATKLVKQTDPGGGPIALFGHKRHTVQAIKDYLADHPEILEGAAEMARSS